MFWWGIALLVFLIAVVAYACFFVAGDYDEMVEAQYRADVENMKRSGTVLPAREDREDPAS